MLPRFANQSCGDSPHDSAFPQSGAFCYGTWMAVTLFIPANGNHDGRVNDYGAQRGGMISNTGVALACKGVGCS